MRLPLTLRQHRVVAPACIRLSLTAAIVVATGCDLASGTGCDSVLVPGLRMDVTDSVSGAGIAPAAGARVIARAGTYADTVLLQSSHVALAHERAGTYTVTVEHPAYLPWSRTGVRVRKDECHVVPTELTARLQAAP